MPSGSLVAASARKEYTDHKLTLFYECLPFTAGIGSCALPRRCLACSGDEM